MKWLRIFFVSAFFIFPTVQIAGGALVSAEDPFEDACQQQAINSAACQSRTTQNPLLGPTGVLTRIIQFFTFVIGLGAVTVIIIGGFKYIISSGDPNKVNSAKDTILYAVIGLVVALLSQAIVSFVLTRL